MNAKLLFGARMMNRSYTMAALALTFFAGASLTAQSTPPADQTAPQTQNRDLTFKKDTTTRPPQTTVHIPRSYALVIGISHYKNLPQNAQLQYPDVDAESIYTVLISTEGGQFPAENVHKLIDDKATVANIRYELETWLPSVTHADDRVLVYFAGHGFVSDGTAYIAPYDIDLHNIPGTAYPMETLGKDIGSKINGQWKVLITDACHSGAITPEADRTTVNRTLLDLDKSLFSITASRDREQSFESDKWGGGHGIFTYYVVKGLEGEADTNGDGIVTADELAEYVHTNVREATNAAQNPTSERGSFDPNMVLAYNPAHVTAANLPPPKYGTLVIETNMDGVEVFVDGESAGIVNKAAALRLPGIEPGTHTIKAVHMGYEPDGPREEEVYPGQETTVSIRILIARNRNHAAVEHFDKGIEYYNKGFEENYRKAADEFEQALAIDPKYSQAALYAGRVYNALYEDEKSLEYFKEAISIDPDYMEARSSYAGALLDTGDMDEAIRQLNIVTQRDADSGMAWYLLSQAFARKGDYDDAIHAAREAIRITPNNAEAHFWLAESLRQKSECSEAENEYNSYLNLSNFDNGMAGKMNYYLAGYIFGMGTKKRAAQTDIWRVVRGQANTGLCDCEWMQKKFDSAVHYCQVALTYTPNDLFTNYRLGILYAQEYNQNGSVSLLATARKHFEEVIEQNPETNEADRSRKYVQNIDSVLAQQP
ncbi:MAG TPA: tetratricopeptide repeat protein [Acidobacteriaceae bacterium]|nr:tetratricopeptide repeat protein [Acidobacteriaceae bacterium]